MQRCYLMRDNSKFYDSEHRGRERCEILADYIIENKCTVRAAAAHFGISKSTIHKDVTKKLRSINSGKYSEVMEVIEINKSERHIRGGMATKQKYRNIKIDKNVPKL